MLTIKKTYLAIMPVLLINSILPMWRQSRTLAPRVANRSTQRAAVLSVARSNQLKRLSQGQHIPIRRTFTSESNNNSWFNWANWKATAFAAAALGIGAATQRERVFAKCGRSFDDEIWARNSLHDLLSERIYNLLFDKDNFFRLLFSEIWEKSSKEKQRELIKTLKQLMPYGTTKITRKDKFSMLEKMTTVTLFYDSVDLILRHASKKDLVDLKAVISRNDTHCSFISKIQEFFKLKQPKHECETCNLLRKIDQKLNDNEKVEQKECEHGCLAL